MKKLISIILVAVFALSFVAAITSAKGPPDPHTICAFVSCDFAKERVKFTCYNTNSGKTYTVWSYDEADWERWCE